MARLTKVVLDLLRPVPGSSARAKVMRVYRDMNALAQVADITYPAVQFHLGPPVLRFTLERHAAQFFNKIGGNDSATGIAMAAMRWTELQSVGAFTHVNQKRLL